MKKIVIALLLMLSGCAKTDAVLRNNIYMLVGKGGECSAVEIHYKKKSYVLTAAHCSEVVENGLIKAIGEDDKEHILSVIAIDHKRDLMLLTAPDKGGVDIAKQLYKHERVKIISHGRDMPAYRTDGELLKEMVHEIGLFWVIDEAGEKKCQEWGGQPAMVSIFSPAMCLALWNNMMTTAASQPGSSGGPAFDMNGDLVGIVSNGDGIYTGLVTLRDISAFLAEHG